MAIWTCADCGGKMKLAEKVRPSLCCVCGGKRLSTPESLARLETYAEYDAELEVITEKLNTLHEQAKPLHERYAYIMQYFRQQKRRGLITEDEYNQRASLYAGLKKRGGKADVQARY